MTRRSLLASAAGVSLYAAAPIPIIDTHIHLFDPTRPQGVPWPPKDNPVLYQPALPARYRPIATPLGVKGAIEVEASPWLEDNQWVLDVAARDKLIVGMVGNLDPAAADFGANLERFHRNPLFLGIRYGNLWGRDLAEAIGKPDFAANLRLLAQAGLVMDSANPNPRLIAALLKVGDAAPGLRIVVDHLPQLNPPVDAAPRDAYQADLRELAGRPTVYVKISEVLRRIDGRVPPDLGFYRQRLDELCGLFGEDRVLFGSDWPNSDMWAPYPAVLGLVRGYFEHKSRAAAEKYFWKNSVAAYRWAPRDSSQPRTRTSAAIR